MLNFNSRWGIPLIGSSEDIAVLRDFLAGAIKNSNSFFITPADDIIILRSSRWDNFSEEFDAFVKAKEDLVMLTGCCQLMDCAVSLSADRIIRFKEDNSIETAIFFNFTKPGNWKSVPKGHFSRFVYLSQTTCLNQAIEIFRRNCNWYDIYKAYEAIRRYCGDENKLFRKFPDLKSQIKQFTRTANNHRHAKGSFANDPNPMSIGKAIVLIRQMLVRIADEAGPAPMTLSEGDQYSAQSLSGTGAAAYINNITVTQEL